MDVNCDLGEGIPHEKDLMAYIDSCSIACGGHFGDESSMRSSLKLANSLGVKAGAHPSYMDKANFGRKVIDIPLAELKKQIIDQIASLNSIAKSLGMTLRHVKAHGALYNEAAQSEAVANALIEAVLFFKQDLRIFVPYASLLHKLVLEKNIKHWVEVFGDRNYNDKLNLIPRGNKNAIIENEAEFEQRVGRMIDEKTVVVEDGSVRHIEFDTLCIHGDHPNALGFLKQLNALKKR